MIRQIRNSIKAVIVENRAVLMIRCRDDAGDFFILPGGGQELCETMHAALLRECREELGCAVEVGELLFVAEYIHDRQDFAWQRSLHQIEYMFRCALPPGETPRAGPVPDDIQVGVEWVPIADLPGLRHYPQGLAEALQNPQGTPVYWGDTV